MRTPVQPLQLDGREAWRTWLDDNHAVAIEAWLLINKKHVTGPGITYDEALDEALCFGWIDGLMRSLGADAFALRFSPRTARSIWSENNKRRVERLIEQGCMHEAGLAVVNQAHENGEWDKATEREDTSIRPPDLEQALQDDLDARICFEKLAPSHKKRYIYWVTSAKKASTRRKRIQEIIRLVSLGRGTGAP